MPLANSVVARLAERAPGWAAPDYCGLLLACNWPAPKEVREAYNEMRNALAADLPACAYLYPAATIHCTIATLRAFTGGPLDGEARDAEALRWSEVLNAARAMPEWPTGQFKLRLNAPTLEGAAGIVKYEEIGGTSHIEAMRKCVREAIKAAGGVSAEGSADRSSARALPGAPKGEPAPHIPNIVHSTVLRWAAEPTEDELAVAHAAFKLAANKWVPFELTVDTGANAVFEDVPFMHIPHVKAQIFWRSESGPNKRVAGDPPLPRSWLSLFVEALFTFLVVPALVVLVAAFFGKKKYFALPGKPQP